MNKKLFGTLLLGSLLMGGTFVSCKDYDDDIEISEQLAEFDETTKQMITEAHKKAEETVGKVADYVTAVKLVVLPTTDLTFESSKIIKANEKEFGKADTYAKDKAQSASSIYAYKRAQ